jgi:hypothetical protein
MQPRRVEDAPWRNPGTDGAWRDCLRQPRAATGLRATNVAVAQRVAHRRLDLGKRERLQDHVVDQRVEVGGAFALVRQAVIGRMMIAGWSRAVASASAYRPSAAS